MDFKAIYPRVPPGIFAGFPGVAHFLSFEEICQYPRVPQGKVANPWGTLGYYFPGVNPREIKIPGVHLTFLKHLNITNFLNEQYLVFLCPFAAYYLRYAVRSFFTMYRISLADVKRAGQKVQRKIAVAVQNVKPLYFLFRSFEIINGKRT